MTTPATIDYSRLPVPVIVALIPESQPNQNPGIPMDPKSGTWHETANYANGADALMHKRYIEGGGGGQQVSWHFTVDDKVIVQHIPLNRVAWHAGDGNGQGNYTSVAVECCVNADGDLGKAQYNVAALFGLLRAEGIIETVYQHNHWTGKDCPRLLRQGNTVSWAEAQEKIAAFARKYETPPAPQPSPIWWEPGEDWGPQTRTNDGAIAWAFLGEVRAKRDVPLRKDASPLAEVVHRLKTGDAVRIVGTYKAKNKTVWAMLEYAPGKIGRAVLSAFNPYRWPTV